MAVGHNSLTPPICHWQDGLQQRLTFGRPLEERTPMKPETPPAPGSYRARLKRITCRRSQTHRHDRLRFVFQVAVPGVEEREILAAKSYEADLEAGSELMNDLERWRGCAVTFAELDTGTFTLADCLGALADVEVEVRRGRLAITSIWPPGILGGR